MAARLSNRSALDQLRRDERAAILRRRRHAGLGNARARQLPTVGLALSGGGVRSATFGLGLLRGLAAQRLLTRVDYLSTISGGGYVGAMLGRLVSSLGIAQAQLLLAEGRSDILDWLRSNGRYLTPAGSRDVGILIVSYLRAFLAVHLEAFFALALVGLAVTLPHLLQDGLRLPDGVRLLDPAAWDGWPSPWFALALLWSALLLPCLLVAYWAAPETRSPDVGQRHLYPGDIFLLVGLLVLALVLTWCIGPLGLLRAWRHADPALPLLVLALWSAAVGHAGAMTYLARAQEPRPLAVARLRNRLTYGLRDALLGCLLLASAGALDWASWALLLMLSSSAPPGWVWDGLGLGGALLLVLRALAPVLTQLATQAQSRHTLALGPQLLNIAGHLGGIVLLLAWLLAVQWWVFTDAPLAPLQKWAPWMRWAALALLALLWWVFTARLPQAANASSLAGFYQARLVRAWLAVGNRRRGICTPFTPADRRRRNVTEVVPGDDVELSQHHPEAKGGALHLIGSCLNQTRDDASGLFNADRKGQLAIASARALEIGPEVVRWEQGEQAQPQGRAAGTLGGWVAVSGAAAAPGAGAYTSRGWALVMFLLGIRLGRWIAAPLPVDLPAFKDWLWRRAPKPLMLWSEARAMFFGQARPWWYLSDGGHFDNTGVYALIKRECDFIILSDGSADPDYRFADIENLVRKARIDLGAEIEFYSRQEAARLLSLPGDNLTILSPDELADNSTRRGVLLARIRYRRSDPAHGEREGTLLVIKPNLHICLDLDLLAYAQRHPSFPHESTGDQFFDEAQWESYQRLGEDTGQALYDRWLAQLPGWDRVQLHKLALPERLHQPDATPTLATAGAAARGPWWRRGVGAAAIGTSVGVGVTGTLLVSLWQLQDQYNRSADSRQAEIRQLLTDSSKDLLQVTGSCARVGAQTLANVEKLQALNGSGTLSAAEQTTVTRLLERLKEECTANAAAIAQCAKPARTHQGQLCLAAQNGRSSGSALSYWHPLQKPTDTGPAPTPTSATATANTTSAPPLPASCDGTRLYTQIYDEATRAPAEQLRQRLQQAGAEQLHTASIENVTRTAALRQQRPPVPWRQPTFIVHDAQLKPCAEALGALLQQSAWAAEKPWVTGLPANLKAQPHTMELWLPAPQPVLRRSQKE